MTPVLFSAAYLLDLLIGDPDWFPHPVRFFGKMIVTGERLLRRSSSHASELAVGALLTIAVTATAGFGSAALLTMIRTRSHLVSDLVSVILAWTCLATRDLLTETASVARALKDGSNIDLARGQVGRIVGRDTAGLEEPEIVRAVIETLAESSCDGIVAPMFYLAVGGVPAAMAYKAINTLDSMIGHNDTRYAYFGKAAARLDDLVNLIPARLTALLIAMAAALWRRDCLGAVRIWFRDAHKHASPNAGRPEAAMAGALQVRLGGTNYYDGEPHHYSHLGESSSPLSLTSLADARRITATVSILMALLVFAWLRYVHGRYI